MVAGRTADEHVHEHLLDAPWRARVTDETGTEFALGGIAERHVVAQDLQFLAVLLDRGQRANPQFDEDTLRRHLARSGRSYVHLAALGGLRGKTTGVAPDVNALWTNRSFHRYADYALTPAFRTGLEHLLREGHQQRCAIMCAEAVWWRCHRRIVADHLLACGETVLHIMGHGRIEPARLTPGAVVQPDGALVYPAEVGA